MSLFDLTKLKPLLQPIATIDFFKVGQDIIQPESLSETDCERLIKSILTNFPGCLDQITEENEKEQVRLAFRAILDQMGGDQLRNLNCYHLLKYLKEFIPEDLRTKGFKSLNELPNSVAPASGYDNLTRLFEAPYNPEYAYGNEYSLMLEDLQWRLGESQASGQFDTLIKKLYENDAYLLERSYETIRTVLENERGETSASFSKTRRTIADAISSRDRKRVNSITPSDADGFYERFMASFVRPTYQPMLGTRLPTVMSCSYCRDFKQISIGTQGEYLPGYPRINPLFEAYLSATRPTDPDTVTHVYFNNLKLARGTKLVDYERNSEAALSEQLNTLENRYAHLAVITLPADNQWFSAHFLSNSTTYSGEDVYLALLSMARHNGAVLDDLGQASTKPGFDLEKDFFISDRIKRKLFGDKPEGQTENKDYNLAREREVMEGLLNRTYKDLGIEPTTSLSSQQVQAIYFHFIKFKLTNFIISKLKPKTVNFSCKDGIDRGGVSSAYYNLIKSIEKGQPLTEEEFYRALHAASTMVKGRGMNHHAILIHNAIATYAQGRKPSILTKMPWLKAWIERYQSRPSPEAEQSSPPRQQSARELLQEYLEEHPDQDDEPLYKLARTALSCREIKLDYLIEVLYRLLDRQTDQSKFLEEFKNFLGYIEDQGSLPQDEYLFLKILDLYCHCASPEINSRGHDYRSFYIQFLSEVIIPDQQSALAMLARLEQFAEARQWPLEMVLSPFFYYFEQDLVSIPEDASADDFALMVAVSRRFPERFRTLSSGNALANLLNIAALRSIPLVNFLHPYYFHWANKTEIILTNVEAVRSIYYWAIGKEWFNIIDDELLEKLIFLYDALEVKVAFLGILDAIFIHGNTKQEIEQAVERTKNRALTRRFIEKCQAEAAAAAALAHTTDDMPATPEITDPDGSNPPEPPTPPPPAASTRYQEEAKPAPDDPIAHLENSSQPRPNYHFILKAMSAVVVLSSIAALVVAMALTALALTILAPIPTGIAAAGAGGLGVVGLIVSIGLFKLSGRSKDKAEPTFGEVPASQA